MERLPTETVTAVTPKAWNADSIMPQKTQSIWRTGIGAIGSNQLYLTRQTQSGCNTEQFCAPVDLPLQY
jgi:hypothetical protein